MDNVKATSRVLNKYSAWVGQCVNLEKLHVNFTPNTKRAMKRRIKIFLGYKDLGTGSLYLGNSLVFGKKKINKLAKLKDKVQPKMER